MLATLVRLLFNWIYFVIFPHVCEKHFKAENNISHKQTNTSSKMKPFTSYFPFIAYVFVFYL